jgi:hypothetical protein
MRNNYKKNTHYNTRINLTTPRDYLSQSSNPLAVRPAASQQSDAAVIGPTGQARLGLADDPRRLGNFGNSLNME